MGRKTIVGFIVLALALSSAPAAWGDDGGDVRDAPMALDGGLAYCTYIGGAENETSQLIAIDGEDNTYVAGITTSTDFPTTSGAYMETWTFGDNVDKSLFLCKFDGSGNLLWSTYLGSSEADAVIDMDVGPDGNVYLLGVGGKLDFPTTPDAINSSGGVSRRMFLAKMRSDGTDLLYGTFLGGSNLDMPGAMAIDGSGAVYITGYTHSDDLPVTPGAYCSTYHRGDGGVMYPSSAAFYMRISADLHSIEACTYIQGIYNDTGYTISLEDTGDVLICGDTQSPDFPATTGRPHSAKMDVFLLRMDKDGTTVKAGTFVGGNDTDNYGDIAIGSNGTIYIAGRTASNDFPLTPNSHDTVIAYYESFHTVLSNDLGTVIYSSYIGGNGHDIAYDLVLSPDETVAYIYGWTWSDDLPVTKGCYDPIFRGNYDLFIMGLRTDHHTVEYCTYIADDQELYSQGGDLEVDGDGALYMTGNTNVDDLPVSPTAWQRSLEGDTDGYLIMLVPAPVDPPTTVPSGLVATGAENGIVLNWTPLPRLINGSNLAGYVIYRGENPDDMARLGQVAHDLSGQIDTDVANFKRYYYRICVLTGGGEGPLGNMASAAAFGPPSAPTDLALSTGNGSVEMAWTPPPGPNSGYRVFKGDTRLTLEVLETIGNVTTWEDTDVVIGTFYYYAVMAVNQWGASNLSEAKRIKAMETPSRPPNFNVVPDDGKVSLSWGYPTNDGGTMLVGFRVWRMTGGRQMEVIATLDPSRLKFTDTNVTNGVSYTYQVTAFSEVGEGNATDAVDAIPFGRPGTVEELSATPGDGSITVVWTAPSSDGGSKITGYTLHWGTSSGNLDQTLSLGNITSFTHGGLENGVTHHYQIAPENAAGMGPVSVIVHATPMGVPGTVRDVSVTLSQGGVLVTWAAPSDTGGAASLTYRVSRGTTSTGKVTLTDLTDKFEYTDEDVITGTTYRYWVMATSPTGEGPEVGPVEVTVAVAPGPVTGLVVSSTNAQVSLSWEVPSDDGGSPIIEYVVRRGIFQDALTEIARVTALNHTDTGVENGKTYYYGVLAVNRMGSGTPSTPVSAKPLGPPGTPGLFTAKVKGKGIHLSWAAPAAGNTAEVTGYRVYRGLDEYELELLAELGPVTSYEDMDVEKGRLYYYKVVATSDSGDSEMSRLGKAKVEKEEEPGFGAAMAVSALVVLLVAGRTRPKGRKRHPLVR